MKIVEVDKQSKDEKKNIIYTIGNINCNNNVYKTRTNLKCLHVLYFE